MNYDLVAGNVVERYVVLMSSIHDDMETEMLTIKIPSRCCICRLQIFHKLQMLFHKYFSHCIINVSCLSKKNNTIYANATARITMSAIKTQGKLKLIWMSCSCEQSIGHLNSKSLNNNKSWSDMTSGLNAKQSIDVISILHNYCLALIKQHVQL